MRLIRTKTIPRSGNPGWDGAQLGAVLANVIGLPFVFGMYWAMGWMVFGVIFFGGWVFVLTLWGRMYDFAVRLDYPPREEVDDDAY